MISSGKTKIYTSTVYEGAKKGSQVLSMVLDKGQMISGDIMVEVFNKPKMMKKVGLIFTSKENVD